MGSGISLDNALLMAVVLEGILYGFSLLMFIGTIWVLTRGDGRYSAHPMVMILIAIALLVLSTAHMVINIIRIDNGLIKYRDTFPGGPVAYLGDVTQWVYWSGNAIYTLHTLIGDGVVIYRCYVVWQSFWIIIIPCLLWCSVAATGVGAVYTVSQDTVNATNVFAHATSQWITAFLASTFSTNLLSSGLLAYRVWSVERSVASKRTSKSTLKPALYAFIDAAILYSVTLFVALICFATGNYGENVIVTITMPIISIAFYMVLIRMALWRNSAQYTSTTTGKVATQDILSQLGVHVPDLSTNDAAQTLVCEQGNREGPSV